MEGLSSAGGGSPSATAPIPALAGGAALGHRAKTIGCVGIALGPNGTEGAEQSQAELPGLGDSGGCCTTHMCKGLELLQTMELFPSKEHIQA